jgi:hypothetical protein
VGLVFHFGAPVQLCAPTRDVACALKNVGFELVVQTAGCVF